MSTFFSEPIEESALRHLPMGSSALAVALKKCRLIEDGYPGVFLLGDVLDELPDVPPRTGDCAELLDM